MVVLTDQTNSNDLVFLIHGFLSKRLLMKPLEWQINSYGFPTQCWGYPSYYGSLRKHSERLRPVIEKVCRQNERVHFVAHSMGTIVLRLALEYGRLPNLGRIVLMAPPNQGTPTARYVSPLFSLFCSGISELSDQPSSLVNGIETRQELNVGVIAGNFDWIVPKSRTWLNGQRDHICLQSTHNSMLVLPGGARRVVEFLEHGSFQG